MYSAVFQYDFMRSAHSLHKSHPDARSARYGQDHFVVPQTNSECNLRKPDHGY